MKGRRSPQLHDRLLVPRIQSYAHSNDCRDAEAVCEYLRHNYKEYQRHKLGPFRAQVARAIEVVTKHVDADADHQASNRTATAESKCDPCLRLTCRGAGRG